MAKKRLAVVDIETTPFKWQRAPTPFLIGYYDGEIYLPFKTVAEFVAHVSELDVLIYAHNGGKFDFLFMLAHFEPYREIRLINGRVAQFNIGKATLRDSFCILPMPLKDYKKDEIDFNIFEDDLREMPANRRLIQAYNKADCVYSFELIEKFHENYGRQLTLAASAMQFWKKQSGRTPPDSGQKFHDDFAPFYFGGRVQKLPGCPAVVNGPVNIYDVNSAYPNAMKFLHPYGYKAEAFSDVPSKMVEQCMIRLTAQSVGAFPCQALDKSTSFPADGEIREFKITGWEFVEALRQFPKLKYKIITCWKFAEYIEFGEYVDHFYKIKNTAPKGSADYIFAKLMMNSLYGKFGANPHKYQKYILAEPDQVSAVEEKRHPWAADKVSDYKAADNLQPWVLMTAPLLDEEKRFYNVATAASITGFQRAFLFKYICQADTPYYCDTDSIHCKALPVETSHALGAWDIEFRGKHACYAGKKLYVVSDTAEIHDGKNSEGKFLNKIASKGARLPPTQIEKIALGGTVRWENPAPSMSLKGGIRFVGRNIKAT